MLRSRISLRPVHVVASIVGVSLALALLYSVRPPVGPALIAERLLDAPFQARSGPPAAEMPLRLTSEARRAAAPHRPAPHDAPRRHATPPGLRGIDVSHWNHVVKWKRVRAAGLRFAIMKATEGRTRVDRTYARNRRRALRAGLEVAAYHFALPDRHARDAVIEANHFLKVARIRSGDIVPVLDLETSGGLGHRDLIHWTRAFLSEVYRRTGVKALIYTGALRWKTDMRNTERFARSGYPLWIANWGSDSPWVPAHNWAGHGWTFWQHAACGHVPGIKKCVDLDRYRGTELTRVRVPGDEDRPAPRRHGCGPETGKVEKVKKVKARAKGPASRIERSRSDHRTSHAGRDTGPACGGRG